MMKDNNSQALRGIHYINKNTLPLKTYTLSLLQKGLDLGLLDTHHHLKIQKGILDLLQDTIMRYTNGKSTSATIDTTEDLLCSIMYVFDYYAMRYDDPVPTST